MMMTGTISGVRTSAVDERPARKAAAGQPERGQRAEHGREDRGQDGDLALFTIPDDHCRSVSIRSYHWSEKPSGGKLRIRASVKLIGTMTSVGASR